MLLPLLLFILVIFIAPFPALYRGDISGLGYLVSTLGRLFLLMGGLFLLSFGWRRLAAYGTESALARAILHVPVLGGLIRRQQRFDFLYNLSLLLAAGLPAFDALETAAQGVSHPSLRRQFKVAASFCRDGQDVVSSLERCGAFEDADAAALGRSGEFSGQLDQMIRHHVDQLGERLDRQYTLLGEWLPRVFYLLLLLYLVMA
jgi:type II secretory pathway component PulF